MAWLAGAANPLPEMSCLLMRIGFLLAGIVFISCNAPRTIYSPSPANSPLFSGKGQSCLSFYRSGGGIGHSDKGGMNNGYDIIAGYSISERWAVIGSYFTRKERDVYGHGHYNFFDSSDIRYRRRSVELGGGYFAPANARKTVFLAVYAGGGPGKFSFVDRGSDGAGLPYERKHSGNVTKWFIQPSIYFPAGNSFRFAMAWKFTILDYGRIVTDYSDRELEYFDLDALGRHSYFFFEPNFRLQFGIPKAEWVKVEALLGFSTGGPSSSANIQARSMNASLGLHFDFTRIKK